MKTKMSKVLIPLLLGFLFSCSQNEKKANYDSQGKMSDQAADTVQMNAPSEKLFKKAEKPTENESVKKENDGNYPERKFVRTADMKFRVKNVSQSTVTIENIARHFGGFVTLSNLASDKTNTKIVKTSADSSQESTWYEVSSQMILSVPETLLDTTLKTIALQVDYLDYRTIKADDVALQMLANRLSRTRHTETGTRLQNDIDIKGKKIEDIADAENQAEQNREQADADKLSNLALNDKVLYSTVTLNLYQRENVSRVMIANDKYIPAYAPGIGERLSRAFIGGWHLLESLVVVLTDIWPLIILALVVFILYRRYGRRKIAG